MNFFKPFVVLLLWRRRIAYLARLTAGCVLKQRADYLGNPLQGLPSSSCALFCCLRLLTSPTTNLISLPFSHPTYDLHDVNRLLFRATSPKSWASNFYSGVNGAILGVKNKKWRQKSVCCLHFFLNLSNNSTNLMAYRGDNLAILSLKILINYWKMRESGRFKN